MAMLNNQRVFPFYYPMTTRFFLAHSTERAFEPWSKPFLYAVWTANYYLESLQCSQCLDRDILNSYSQTPQIILSWL